MHCPTHCVKKIQPAHWGFTIELLEFEVDYFFKILDNVVLFKPISTGVGHFWPQPSKTAWHFHSFVARLTKIHDFVYFSTCLVPIKLFLKKKL